MAPANVSVSCGFTFIVIVSVSSAHTLVFPTAPVVMSKVYEVAVFIAASGLPEIVKTPPILSASGTKLKFTPEGRLAGGFTDAKVPAPTTVNSIGVISAP